jgi:hypothetical protein
MQSQLRLQQSVKVIALVVNLASRRKQPAQSWNGRRHDRQCRWNYFRAPVISRTVPTFKPGPAQTALKVNRGRM